MTDTLTGMFTEEEFLEQSGVKGMKWGVTREQAAAGNKKAAKTLAKADHKQMQELHSIAGFVKVNNAVADKMNGPDGIIAKHNADPKYKGIDHNNANDPRHQKYLADFEKKSNKVWLETTKEIYGDFPSGNISLKYKKNDAGQDYLELVDKSGETVLFHADAGKPYRLYLKTDPTTGNILGIDSVGDDGTLTHSIQKGQTMAEVDLSGMLSEDDFLEHVGYRADMTEDEQSDFLEHYGKKGMKWGQRIADRELGVAGKARTSTGNSKSRKDGSAERSAAIDAARKRTFGGENKAAVKDAKVAAKSAKGTDGAAAAKAALRAARDKKADDKHDAGLAKAGNEAVLVALGGSYGHLINMHLAKKAVKNS